MSLASKTKDWTQSSVAGIGDVANREKRDVVDGKQSKS